MLRGKRMCHEEKTPIQTKRGHFVDAIVVCSLNGSAISIELLNIEVTKHFEKNIV